jgi:hypothetical protein
MEHIYVFRYKQIEYQWRQVSIVFHIRQYEWMEGNFVYTGSLFYKIDPFFMIDIVLGHGTL